MTVYMKSTLFICLSLCLILAASACSKPNSNNSNQVVCQDGKLKSAGIIGGQAVPADSVIAKGTVFILHKKQVGEETKLFQCTGSLIDESTVLTAAHCVPPNEDTNLLRVAFSIDPICQSDNEGSEGLRKVEKIIVHENYIKAKQTEDDVALLRIEGVAPAGKQPFKLVSSAIDLNPSSQIFVAGYGRTADGLEEDKADTKLKLAKLKVTDKSSVEKKNSKSTSAPVLYLDQRNGQGACQGDSGGPTLLVQGNDLLLIGIISAGDTLTEAQFKSEKEVTCKLGLRVTSVLAKKEWIQSTYLKLREDAAPDSELFK